MDLKRNDYQRNSTWNTPYTFSGKEKDVETGYGYFGARYYDSGLSIWLSVDPMSDKYPSMSPYNYCANNPVMLVDPDGRTIYHPGSEFMNRYGTVYTNLKYNRVFQSLLSGYNSAHNDMRFTDYSEVDGAKAVCHSSGPNISTRTNGETTTQVIWDNYIMMNTEKMQSEIGLVKTFLHEAVHARDVLNGTSVPKNHAGFDQQAVFDGLIEYRDLHKLPYSNENLEAISWSGLSKSPEFEIYIQKQAEKNKRTYDEQYISWQIEVEAICRFREPN